jgi:DNA (cytosine-5)-methyltransferase 1
MEERITFGSVCSGIEAASVAWHPLGFETAWVSEIDPFPSAVLATRFPKVPNLGDLRNIKSQVLNKAVAAPDILVGGTPCQAFSVAGLRAGLSDARGSLSLSYVELANAIDKRRHAENHTPCLVIWENVPGVLSTKDNAFGCFLGGLAGENCPLEPPGKKWSDAGCVFGPKRTVAWRVLDAQYFGLAQRRRRVFVCAVGRASQVDPTKILFEFEGSRLDVAPRKSSGQAMASSAEASTGAHEGPVAIQGNVIGRRAANGPGGKGYSSTGVCYTLNCTDRHAVATGSGQPVRRLTPVEHERLQGFSDNWTNVPWAGEQEALDGHRYHAVGNSMAVPVMAWIGRRAAAALGNRARPAAAKGWA